jgi:hypothetical protein
MNHTQYLNKQHTEVLSNKTSTDKDKVESLLGSLNIGFRVDDGDIICESGDLNVTGYNGFFTCFRFDSEGEFIEMGSYE